MPVVTRSQESTTSAAQRIRPLRDDHSLEG